MKLLHQVKTGKLTDCLYDGCERVSHARGHCLRHYRRLKRAGVLKKIPVLSTCTVGGCFQKHLARSLCKMHYRRFIATGDETKYRGGVKRGGSEKHPLYTTFLNMVARCYNPKQTGFKNYGGRGIGVCQEWLGEGGFQKFIAHVGSKPDGDYSLDRINNNGNYEPGNVRWATRKQQNANRKR